MKVSVFHGFLDIHYEMLGYLIEYLLNNNIEYSIYCPNSNISFEWIQFYNNIFKTKLNWKNMVDFNEKNYDYIILATDDDKYYIQNYHLFSKICNKKIICIDHHYYIRNASVYYRISTRFFKNKFDNKWILPCYNGIKRNYKKNIIENNNQINITCVGNTYPRSIYLLKKLFINFEQINFNIITRKYNKELDGYDNIKIHNKCPTDKMIEIIINSNYIYCSEYSTDYENLMMSAIIPISFSFGCQLIIPESWNKYYSFTSCIEYNENSKLEVSKCSDVDNVMDELYILLRQKQKVFSNVLFNNNSYSFPIINFISKYNLKVPNILIDINSDIDIIECKKYFIEIHTLKNHDHNGLYIYDYNDEKQMLNFLNTMISDDVIIFLNFTHYKNNIKKLIKIIQNSKRLYNDILVIQNLNKEDDIVYTLKKATKKIVWHEFFDNNLIIMPQLE